MILKILVPNNLVDGTTTLSVTGTSTGTATLHEGQWTSGDLEAFLGIANSSPANPIGAYLPSTQALDPGATGFSVFTFDAGQYSLPVPGAGAPPDLFQITGGVPIGSYAVADLMLSNGNDVATANSGALFVTTAASVPGPIVGAGLPGIVAGCLGLLGLARWRRRKVA